MANTWLEGTYTERYPHVSRNERAWPGLFRQFSFPGGIPSHCSPETPGSIHEGGELGYSLSHAFGAAFDNPDLLVACVVGDGEAETGRRPPVALEQVPRPAAGRGGLPILHLNGYKIAAPTVLARIPEHELLALFTGYGYRPVLVEGGFDGERPDGRARPHGRRARRHRGRDPRHPGARPARTGRRGPTQPGRC